MRAIYENGQDPRWAGPWSDTMTKRVRNHPPGAPTDLSVDSATHDGVVLIWSAPTHPALTGYRILRGSSADALETIVEDTGDRELTYTDTTAADDATYHYATIALSLDGDGAQSGAVSATTPPRTPEIPVIEGTPATPANLTAQLDGSGGVTLSWTDPDDEGITGYRILRGGDALSMRIIVENTSSANANYTDATAAVNSTHVYAVQARNSVGLSQLSNTVSATPLGAPTNLLLAASSDSRVILSWTGPDSITVTGYRILRGPSADALATLLADTGGTATAHEDGTAEADTTYHYAVNALGRDGEGPSSATARVKVPPATKNNEPRDPPPPTVPDPQITEIVNDEDPQISEEQSVVLVDLTTLSNVVVSNINQTGAGSHLLNSGDQVAYRVGAIPNRHGRGNGYNITGVKIALSDFVRGTDGVQVRIIEEFKRDDSNSHLDDIEPMSSIGGDPLIGYFSSAFDSATGVLSLSPGSAMKFNGGAYPHCTVIRPPATPSDSDNDCRNLDYSKFINGNGFYVVIKATYGSFSVLHTAGEHDIQVGHDLNADLEWGISSFSYKRAPSGWQKLTGTNKPLMLVTAEKRSVVAATSPPAPVPARPPAPSVSASTYRVGQWQSVDLSSTGGEDKASFGHGTYRVSLSRNTTYRIEFRTVNTYTSADSFHAAAQFKNLTIDRSSALLGSPIYVYEPKCSDGTITDFNLCPSENIVDDTTKPRFSLTEFAFNDTSLEAVFADERLVYHDFRTPAVLAASGEEHCNEETEIDDVTCVYSYDYPQNYYLDAGLAFTSSDEDFGRMQFRIARASDQSLTGMTALREEVTCTQEIGATPRNTTGCLPSSGLLDNFVLVAGTPANEANNTPASAGESTKDGEVHFPGDVDWFSLYIPVNNGCAFTAAGRDVDGNSASGLRMRIFDAPGSALKAPSRGSLRTSIVNHSSDGETVLEITGSGAGGYTITGSCSAMPPATPTHTAVSPGERLTSCTGDDLCDEYDDLLPRHYVNKRTENAVTDERRLPTSYGRITVGGTARGALEDRGDWDIFPLEVTPNTDYRVRVTSASRTVSLRAEDLVVEVTAAPAVPAVDAVPEVPDDPDTTENEFMAAVPAVPAQPAITGVPGEPALAAWSYTYSGILQADLSPLMLVGEWVTDDKGTPDDTSDDTRTCELDTGDKDGVYTTHAIYIEVGPGEVTFSSGSYTCLAVVVASKSWVRSVGGYSLRVTSEGSTFVPGSDDDYSPLIATEPNTWYSDHIVGEWDHDNDESTANQTLSQMFGRLSGGRGSGKIDTYQDTDMFKHQLSAGTHGVRVYDAETLDTACKTSSGSSRPSCTSVQSSLNPKADRMMRPKMYVLSGVTTSSDYTHFIEFAETSTAGRRWCSGAVDYRAEVPYQSEINIEDNPDTPEDESANNRPERQRVPEVAGVRPACEKPLLWIPLEITEAGDYYFAVSPVWNLPLNRRGMVRDTGQYNIELASQSTQPSISSVSVSDITRTSAKFTVVVSNSWVNRVYVKTTYGSRVREYPSKLTSAAKAGQSDTLVFDTTASSDGFLIAGGIHTVSVSTTPDFSSNVVTRTFRALP